MRQQLSLSLDAAHERGTRGLMRAAARTERAVDGWVDLAVGKLREFAEAANSSFTIEQARSSFESSIPAPKDLRAFGAVTRKACALGIITRVGYAPTVTSNGSPKPLYSPGTRACELAEKSSFSDAEKSSIKDSPACIEPSVEAAGCRTSSRCVVGNDGGAD